MKITESKLRRIIRNVIQESMDPATKRNLDNLEVDMLVDECLFLMDIGECQSLEECFEQIGKTQYIDATVQDAIRKRIELRT